MKGRGHCLGVRAPKPFKYDIVFDIFLEVTAVCSSFLFEPTLTMIRWTTDWYRARKLACPSDKATFLKWSARLTRTGGKWVTTDMMLFDSWGVGGGGGSVCLLCYNLIASSGGLYLQHLEHNRSPLLNIVIRLNGIVDWFNHRLLHLKTCFQEGGGVGGDISQLI